MTSVIHLAIAGVLVIAAFVMVAWSFRGAHPGGARRAYNLVFAALLLIAAVVVVLTPRYQARGWHGLLPDRMLVARLTDADRMALGGWEKRGTPLMREVHMRLRDDELSLPARRAVASLLLDDLAPSQWLRTRERWPADLPIVVEMQTYGFYGIQPRRVQVRDEASGDLIWESPELTDQRRHELRPEGAAPEDAAAPAWYASHFTLRPPGPDGLSQRLRVNVMEVDDVVWSREVEVDVAPAASVDAVLAAEGDPDVSLWLAAQLDITVEAVGGGVCYLRVRTTSGDCPPQTGVELHVQLLHGGTVVDEVRPPVVCDAAGVHTGFTSEALSADALRGTDLRDPAWMLRVTGVADEMLGMMDVERYWSGTYVVPLRDVLVDRRPENSSNP